MSKESTIKPAMAAVSCPGAGKSTLVNRILGHREAMVQDVPGVTRDRVSYDTNQNDREFMLVSTGGWTSGARGMAQQIVKQAELAISVVGTMLLVVDATVGILDEGEVVVKVPRRSGKPVVLVANKVDDQRHETVAVAMWNLGLGESYPVSAICGQDFGNLLDTTLAVLPEAPRESFDEVGRPHRVVIVGKPSVGRSSLLSKLAQQQRAVASDVSRTTVDPVDEIVEVGGTMYRLIDTAGTRKRVRETSGHEFYAGPYTQAVVEHAEVCVTVIGASTPIAGQDLGILTNIEGMGQALVIAFNKWGLTDEKRRCYLERKMERNLVAFRWAPVVSISVLTGHNVDRPSKTVGAAVKGQGTRVSIDRLNSFLGRLVASHPHPVRDGRQPRILFDTRAYNCPLTSALLTSSWLDATCVCFIERRLREEFGSAGSPIHMEIQIRGEHRNRR